MVSIEDVARRAGVSPITASRVIRNLGNVATATRDRVQLAAIELGYIPNGVARGLRQARSGLIALIITDITSPFFSTVTQGAEDAARAAGMKLILGNSYDDPEFEADYLRSFGEHRVDGLVVVPTGRAGLAFQRFLPPSIPVVVLDRQLLDVETDLVRCDTAAGTARLCEHLLALGHRRIAIAGGSEESPTWHERVHGYRAAQAAAGIAVDEHLIRPANYKGDGGAAVTRALFASAFPPDAIIAGNAQVALGVLDALVELGIRVPDDVSVAAIDDPLPRSSFWPRLTVVDQPGYEMGKAAIGLVLSRLNGDGAMLAPRELVFQAQLKIGLSCGEQLRRTG